MDRKSLARNVNSKLESLTYSCPSFGAAAITLGLPVLLYFFTFGCNDVTGCPVPSLLHPRTLSWENLRSEIGWPKGGVWDLASWEVTGVVLAYYIFSMILWRALPAQEVYGTKLVQHGRPLKYRLNGKHVHHNHIRCWPELTFRCKRFRPPLFTLPFVPLGHIYRAPTSSSGPT